MSATALKPIDSIRATVAALLAEPGPAWKADLIARYVRQAQDATAHAIERYKARDKAWHDRRGPMRYVRIPSMVNYRPSSFDDHCRFADEGLITAEVIRATKDAESAYESACAAFVEHVTEKLASCFAVDVAPVKLRVHGKLSFQGMIVGSIAVEETNSFVAAQITKHAIRARLGIHVQIKTNYRYGMNSENRQLTVYHQYPITISFVEVEGQDIAASSIEQAALAISGRRPTSEAAAARKARVDAKTARRNQLHMLQRRKDLFSDIENTVGYALSNIGSANTAHDRVARVAKTMERVKEWTDKLGLAPKVGVVEELIEFRKGVVAQRNQLRAEIKALKAVKL